MKIFFTPAKKFFYSYWPLLVIFLIWLTFSSPYFLKNKVPFPSSYQVSTLSPWSSYPEFSTPSKNGAMPDVIGQIYPWRKLVIEAWKSGQIPLWNPYVLSGTPLLANYQSAALFPLNFLFLFMPFIDAWSFLVLLQPFLAGIFTYLLVQHLTKSKIAGVVSAVSFMFSGFIVTWMSYATLGYAIIFLPLSLLFIEKYLAGSSRIWLFFLSFLIPFSFFAGHFQISVYFLIFIVFYLFFKAINSERKKIFYCFLFIFFGLLMAMPQLLPSYELYSLSLRNSIIQKMEIIPWQWSATFLFPDFFGNPVTRNDWFGHYAEWNIFIGIIPFFLLIYSAFGKKTKPKIFFLIALIVSLLFAFENPISNLIYLLKIPVLSTSAASRIVSLYAFSGAVCAGFGLKELIIDLKNKQYKKLFLISLSFWLIFSIFWLIIFLKIAIPTDKIVISRQNLIFPSFVWIIFSTAILSALFIRKKNLLIFSSLILIILVIDLTRFAQKWQPFDPKNFVFPKTSSTEFFKKISGFDRVIGNLGEEATTYYHLPTVDGYDPLFIKRYGQFVSSFSDGRVKESERSVVTFPRQGKYIWQGIDFLGIKYVIHKFSDGRNSWTIPFWEKPSKFKQIFNDGKYEVWQNLEVFPRAFLVSQVLEAKDDQQAFDFFVRNDMKKQVILEKNITSRKVSDIGTAKIVKYTPNKVSISVNTASPGFLVLTDSFYPGWKATVEGKNLEILRADYAFRAIPVNKGNYLLELSYEPSSFRIGVYLGISGVVLAFIFLFFPKILDRRASSFS